MTTPPEHPLEPMINHWWWRPGWHVGRKFYTWHLTFDGAEDVLRLVREYNAHLAMPGLDIIPERWLHLTMQGIGFVGEVDEADMDQMVASATDRLGKLKPFDIVLGPAEVDPEVVRLAVTPGRAVEDLRAELRAAIADVWSPDRVPEGADDFTPHVSLAYSNRAGSAEPIAAAALAISPSPARMQVTHADLILLNRDEREYRWETFAHVALG